MTNKSKNTILKILGFLFLAAGIVLIVLGLCFMIPEFETIIIPKELYYIIGGIVGISLAGIILVLAFGKSGKSKKSLDLNEQGPDTWNKEEEIKRTLSNSRHAPVSNKPLKIKEKERKNWQSVVCKKCGTANVAGDYYCSGCKSALKQVCKLCGHDNPNGVIICEGCGKIMD